MTNVLQRFVQEEIAAHERSQAASRSTNREVVLNTPDARATYKQCRAIAAASGFFIQLNPEKQGYTPEFDGLTQQDASTAIDRLFNGKKAFKGSEDFPTLAPKS